MKHLLLPTLTAATALFSAALAGIPAQDAASFAEGNPSLPWNAKYQLGADSKPQPGVPQGQLTKRRIESRQVYPGVSRDYWLYVPKQYDAAKPACLMVFQDGGNYIGPDVSAPVVFDNLINKGEIPVIIGLFVNPGDKGPCNPLYGGTNNRSFEYDSLGDRYARFLIGELIPEVEKEYEIAGDPAARAVCGMSSGGICAFTVAWERPDAFGKVVSHCGSFTNIRGGHVYPSLVRGTDKKPLRVFLQSGAHDADLVFGSWPLANQQMAAALKYKGYDYKFEYGDAGHNLKHGGAVFPDTMRWLWRGYPKDPTG
jgi:enterochelin esterase-like enzyme